MSHTRTLGEIKTLGVVGSILVLLTVVPSVGWILGIIGWILILVSVKNLDSFLYDGFSGSMLVFFLLSVSGIVVIRVGVLASIFQFIDASPALGQGSMTPPDFDTLLATVNTWLAIGWILFVLASVFLFKAYRSIGSKTYIDAFPTAGLLFLIGAVATIIFLGLLIVLIAMVYQILAFSYLPEKAEQFQKRSKTRSSALPPETD